MLADSGLPPSALATASARHDYCGSYGFSETIELRPLWSVYLQVVNVSAEAVHLDSIAGHTGEGDLPRPLAHETPGSEPLRIDGPGAALAPDESLILPIATLAGPLEWEPVSSDDDRDGSWVEIGEQTQSITDGPVDAFLDGSVLIGAAFWPSSVTARSLDGEAREVDVRPFDSRRVVILSREWAIGSCPHLFAIRAGGLDYIKPLFTSQPGDSETERVRVPSGSTGLVLAELEHETTFLDTVSVDGVAREAPSEMKRGDVIRISADPGSIVTLQGRYVPDGPVRHQPAVTRALVRSFAEAFERTGPAPLGIVCGEGRRLTPLEAAADGPSAPI